MRDALIAARALIEERGLNQDGSFWSSGVLSNFIDGRAIAPGAGCFCTVGAVCVAVGALDTDHPAARHLAKTLGVHNSDDIYGWNDNPNTTQADVLDLFDRAIETAPVDA